MIHAPSREKVTGKRNLRATEKRRLEEREARRRSILKAALKLYGKHGFNGTTMEEIAQAARLGTATAYYYFKSKEEIYVSLVIEALDIFIEALRKIEESKDAPIEKVRKIWDYYYEYYRKHPAYYRAILFLYRDGLREQLSPEVLERVKVKSGECFRIVSNVIASCVKSGEYRIRDPRHACDVLWATFMGIVHLAETRQNLGIDARGLEELHKEAFDWFELGWRKS